MSQEWNHYKETTTEQCPVGGGLPLDHYSGRAVIIALHTQRVEVCFKLNTKWTEDRELLITFTEVRSENFAYCLTEISDEKRVSVEASCIFSSYSVYQS